MKKKRVKVGKWETVFKGVMFELKQAEAVYSNGKKDLFEKAFRTPSIIVVPIHKNGDVLMIKEYRLALKSYEWFLPAGRMDKETNPKKAAIRELEEETGFTSKKLTLLSKHGDSNTLEYIHYIYLAEDLEPIEKKDVNEDEDITLHPMSFKKALELALDGEIKIPEICFALLQLNAYLKK